MNKEYSQIIGTPKLFDACVDVFGVESMISQAVQIAISLSLERTKYLGTP